MRIRNKLFSYQSLFLLLIAIVTIGFLFANNSPMFTDAHGRRHHHHATPTPRATATPSPTVEPTAESTAPVAPTPQATPGTVAIPPAQPTGDGQNYYVSPTGSDDNDGTAASPFATISQAAQEATPGSVVHVLPGTYTDLVTVKNSGTADAPITFISDVTWGAQIATTGSTDPWTTRADYINIIGFDVTSTGSRDGIENQGSFIKTIGNHVHDIPGGDDCDNIGGSGIDDADYTAHDDDIIGNVVNNIGATYPKLCEYVHGIYHSTARGHILNNISYDNAGCGINLWHAADATVVANNLSFGNKEHGISLGTDTDNTDGDIGDNFVVSNNISIDNALLGIRERKGVGSHNQYLDNIVYGNGDKPFGDEGYDWPSAAGSTDVGTITSNADFVNFQEDGSGDYHLQADSPAIGAGTDTGAPTTDFTGNSALKINRSILALMPTLQIHR